MDSKNDEYTVFGDEVRYFADEHLVNVLDVLTDEDRRDRLVRALEAEVQRRESEALANLIVQIESEVQKFIEELGKPAQEDVSVDVFDALKDVVYTIVDTEDENVLIKIIED